MLEHGAAVVSLVPDSAAVEFTYKYSARVLRTAAGLDPPPLARTYSYSRCPVVVTFLSLAASLTGDAEIAQLQRV